MKLVKCLFVSWIAWHLFTWIDASGSQWLQLSDLVPFSKSCPHSFTYTYAACVMIGLTLWGVWRLYGRRKS